MEQRIRIIDKVLGTLKENKLIEETHYSPQDVLFGFYFINHLLNHTFRILGEKKTSAREKVRQLCRLEDVDGMPLLTKELAKGIVAKGKIYVGQYQKMVEQQKQQWKKTQEKELYQWVQSGGQNTDEFANNMFSKMLNDPELLSENLRIGREFVNTLMQMRPDQLVDYVKTMIVGDGDPSNSLENRLYNIPVIGNVLYLLNIVMFPLAYLESIEGMGDITSFVLDMSGMFLGSSGLITGMIAPIIPKMITMGLSMGSAVPGVGTAFAAAGTASVLAQQPLEYLIAHSGHIFNVFIYIMRKEWRMAYMAALDLFPIIEEVKHTFAKNVGVANKMLGRATKLSAKMVEVSDVIIPMAMPILRDPWILLQPTTFYNEVVLPNYEKIPILRYLPLGKWDESMKKLKEYQEELEMIQKDPRGGIRAMKEKYKDKFLDRLKEISPITARMVTSASTAYDIGKTVGKTAVAVGKVVF